MNHVFVTGAAGFIGGYVVEEFVNRGWRVTALVHRRKSERLDMLAHAGNVKLVDGDVTRYLSLGSILRADHETFDAVVHCAGRASDTGWRSAFRRTNLDSVKHLVRLSKELDVRRFVFVSTTDVYGLRDFRGENEDELPLGACPRNPYPEFKIAAEQFIRNELPPDRYSILRPAQVWGVGDETLTARIVDFLRRSPWIVHFGKWRGRNRWPLAHVRNVAMAAYLAAVTSDAAGTAINVADTGHTTMDEFYRMVARVYLPGRQLKTVTLPFWVGYVIGSLISGVSNLLNLDRPFADPSLYALYAVSKNLDFSNARFLNLAAKENLRPVTLEDGIRELESSASPGHVRSTNVTRTGGRTMRDDEFSDLG